MSQRPGSDPRPRRRPGRRSASGSGASGGPVHLRGRASLVRLRERVTTAARELQRLRAENEALQARVRELEAEAASVPDLPFDEDPEVLKQKLDRFIEAIDAYLNADPDGDGD